MSRVMVLPWLFN